MENQSGVFAGFTVSEQYLDSAPAYSGLVLFSLNMLTKFFAEKIKYFFFLDANILQIMANMRKKQLVNV